MAETKTATKKKKAAPRKKSKIKKNLVIVESPSKAKTIEKYLGRNYKVVASLGHIRDLPKSTLGVDVETIMILSILIFVEKAMLLRDYSKEAKAAKAVYLASDPDREGEAIAWHLQHILDLNPEQPNRVVFNEITKDGD